MADNIPNPGSQEAVDLGCTCPVWDNHHGQGFKLGGDDICFWINQGCLIHTTKNEVEDVSN